MKSEYIALSPSGVIALFTCGFLCCGMMLAPTIRDLAPIGLLTATLLFFIRSDAREAIVPGIYDRGWIAWTRKGPIP